MSDAVVVGAGPAGSAAAIGLARAGAGVLLLERTRETGDALCGGFLSWRTLARLDALGIDRVQPRLRHAAHTSVLHARRRVCRPPAL